MAEVATERRPADRAPDPGPSRRPPAPGPARAPSATSPSAPRPPVVRLSGPAGAAPAELPAPVQEVIAAPGPGSALAPEVAVPLGPGLGADLSPVRVHTDRRAAAATGELGARAFTWGTHVFLGAGERPTDLSVMTHEVAHTVQQSAGPAVHLFGGPHGDLEREAHQASAATLRGERFAVRGRTAGPRVQGLFGWVKRGLQAIGRAASAVANAIAELGSWVIDRVLDFVKKHARSIPGYDLLAFIIGRDPITQDPVERNAINLLRGLVGLIPGGAALFENLQRAGVIQRAGEWFSAEIDKLNLTWEYIRGLFSQAWDALSVSDLASPSRAWDKLKAVFGPPLTRIKNFALSAGRKILEFVFEGALALAGGAAQEVLAIFRRIGAVFGLIVSNPVGFFRNLLTAVKGGFDLFRKNILTHLRTALFDWLLGTLRGVLQLPARFDFEGILSIVLQVLGLTYTALRGILVRLIGEPAVAFIEKTFEFLATVATKGLTAAWEKIKEFASGLADAVIAAIRDWVTRSVVGAAITKLLTLFNPVGALIQAVIGIYNTVMFFIERARQIARLVRSILDSIETIARGGLSAASQFVERTMANTLPVILAFLGRLAGLGDVTKHIRDIITRIQTAIANTIERVARWIADRVRGLLAGRRAGATPSATDTPAQAAVKQAALTEASTKARGKRFGSAEGLAKVLREVVGVHRAKGLRSLTGQIEPAGGVALVARASVPDKVVLSWNDVFSAATQPQQPLYERVLRSMSGEGYGSETYAAVAVNGRLLGARPNAARHAESELLRSGDWDRAVQQADLEASSTKPSEVVLAINRSPCKASCTGVLANWLRANRARHPNVRFILAPTGRYSPEITKEEMIVEIANNLEAKGHRLIKGVKLDDLIDTLGMEQVRPVFEEIFGRLVRTRGAREDEATTETELRTLAGAGWDLRQLQARPKVSPAEGALAAMVDRVRNDLGIVFEKQEEAT